MKPHYNKKPKRDSKPVNVIVTNYEKKFDNFFDMVDDLRAIHPEINNNIFNGGNIVKVEDALDDIINYIINNRPSITERTNLGVSLNLSANKLTLKTTKSFSFGWRFKYDKDGNTSDVVAYVSIFSKENAKVYEDIQDMINILEKDWEKVENKR